MATTDVTYRSIPFKGFAIDRTHAFLVSSGLEAPSTVLGSVPSILAMCLSPGTLDEHEHSVMARWGDADRTFVRSTLERLVRARLLVPDGSQSTERAGVTESRGISTVAVLTAGRPSMLARCLASYLAHCQVRGRRLRFVVLDGSTSLSASESNRRVAHDASRQFGYEVRYVGPDEKRALREGLVARGASTTLLNRAIPDTQTAPGWSGGDRTAALLLAAGEQFLMLDDATVCRPWAPHSEQQILELSGHADPRVYEFFESRDAATPVASMPEADLIGAHEALLGRSLTDLASGVYDARRACTHMATALMDRIAHPRVRVTCAGVAGDSGLTCPYQLLFANGQIRDLLASDQDVFDRALTFRELRRVTARPVVTHDPTCELHCLALDNTSLLPPFPAVGMDAAPRFGQLLALIDPDALFGHVPVAVIHDSDRLSIYETVGIQSASTVSLAAVIAMLAATAGTSRFRRDPGERLPMVGTHLSAVAALPVKTFGELLRDIALDRKCAELVQIADLNANGSSEYPEYWRAALERYRLAALSSVEDRAFFLPCEFVEDGTVEEALERTRSFIGEFGALLQSWPETVGAARDVALDAYCRV